jgi:hypothetical protein
MRRILLLTGVLCGVSVMSQATRADQVLKWNACDTSYRACMAKAEPSCDIRNTPSLAKFLTPERQITTMASCAKVHRRVCAQVHCHRDLMLDL